MEAQLTPRPLLPRFPSAVVPLFLYYYYCCLVTHVLLLLLLLLLCHGSCQKIEAIPVLADAQHVRPLARHPPNDDREAKQRL